MQHAAVFDVFDLDFGIDAALDLDRRGRAIGILDMARHEAEVDTKVVFESATAEEKALLEPVFRGRSKSSTSSKP